MAYALLLYRIAAHPPINSRVAWLIIELDLLWVAASGVLIFTDLLPLTVDGRRAIAIVADAVALFAMWQYLVLRKQIRN